jgi:hypothetical protein
MGFFAGFAFFPVHLRLLLPTRSLVGFDQIANPLGLGFGMTMAGNGIGAAGRFNSNL